MNIINLVNIPTNRDFIENGGNRMDESIKEYIKNSLEVSIKRIK